MFTDFDYFIDSLNLSAIEKVISMPLSDEDKRVALGFVVMKPLEGVSMTFPRKSHLTSFAKLLVEMGADAKVVSLRLEITEKTLRKYKGNNGKK